MDHLETFVAKTEVVLTKDFTNKLALMFLNFYDYGYAVSIVLFGFWNILTGYLIFRSTFPSRILGVAAGNFGLLLPDQQF